jgi:hypothetical protein
MYNAWSQRPPQVCQLVTVIEKAMHEGGFTMAAGGMDYQARRFVEGD